MKIAFNPSTVEALITPPNNKDITFDLRGRNIFARGVKFCGTDTWRDIKINNVSIDSNILDLRNGSNTTLTNTNGVVTINSTWRPVVDNLTSDSTTSSLSANLGRVLKSLIDGKSDSGHTHDDRYLRLTGGTMSGLISSSYSVGTWIEGCTNAILKATADGYNSLVCAPIKSGNISISAWTAEDNLNFGYAKKGKTENSFDTRMYWDAPNNNLHAAAFTGHLYGTADNATNAVNADTTDGVHLEWSGQLTYDLYSWLAGWTNDGKKIKAVNKNLFATSGHTHDDRYLKLSGGTMQLGEGLKFHADENYFGTDLDARIISLLDWNGKICDGGLIIDERGVLDGKEYVTELLRIRDSEFKWKGSNILHSRNSNINGNTITINGSSITVSKSDHTHAYLPLSGGTMTGSIKFNYNSLPQKTLSYVCGIDAFVDGGEMGWMRGSDFVVQYAPTKTGLGASGTWDINITGDADTVDGYHANSFYKIKSLRSDKDSIYDLRYNYGTYDKGDYNGTYKDEYPTNYGAYLALTHTSKNAGALMFFDAPTSNILGHIYVRTRGAGDPNTTYSEWGKLAYITDNVASATKLTSSAGSASLPIYFSDGKPVACTASSIFSNLSNSGNNISVTVAGQNRTLTVGYATSAGYANGIANKGLLDSLEKIDNFITANRFEYATFKTAESNNVGFASNDGMILSIPWTSTSYGAQIAFDDVIAATVKVRSKSINWGNWYTLLHSGNYNNYVPTKTGTGASGTWGINISGNADTVDGVHVTWLGALTSTSHLVAWESDGSALRDINPAHVSVGNSDKVDGYHATSGNNKPWGTIPVITTGGWMDIGKQLEFHYDNTTGSDYSTILRCTGNYSNIIDLPSISGTLALTSQIPNVTNYYWANIKISDTSNSNTAPIFGSAIINTRLSIAPSTLTKTSPTSLQLVINGPYLDDSVTPGLKDWPGIGFHMPGRTWGSLIFNGNITAINSDYNGYVNYYGAGFKKNGSSDSYVLLGGGGHKALSDFMSSTVKYALSDTIGGKALLAYKLYYSPVLKDLASIDNFHEACTFKYGLWLGNSEEMGSSFPGTHNGIILSGGWTSATYGFQLAIDDDPNYFIALRQRSNGTWYTWKRIPMGDGTGASGTWGINITGNADTVDGFHANGLLTALSNTNNGVSITVGGTTKSISNISVNYANSAGNADKLDGLDSTKFLRQVVVPNNTENDFNTFSNMTLTGRIDPTTGASLKNAPWSGSGPAGGYGVLTYLFSGAGYGTQMAWEYGSNRIYIRNRHYSGHPEVGAVWKTSWDTLALTSDIPTSLKNPNSLILKANGTTLAIYDGSSAKEANFTYANIGAASASHTHSNYVTDLGTSGNYLTWTKNGNTSNITVPYAGKTDWLIPQGFFSTLEQVDAFFDTVNHSLKVAYIGNKAFPEFSDGLVLAASVPKSYCHQIHMDDNQPVIHHRSRSGNGDSWSKWSKLLDSSNYSSYAIPVSASCNKNWSYSGQSDLPTWLWGTNDGTNCYVWNPSNFRVAYASSAGNADTLDGIHASNLLTSVTNTNNGISVTVGGTTKSVSNISVNYAASAGSANSAIQATNLTPENTPHYFRDPSNSAWRGGMYWGSAGNESMSFVAANGGTRFQFVGGSDIANWTSSTWQSVTPYLTIYSSGIVTPGSVTATNGFIKSNSSDSYVLLGGGGHKAESSLRVAYATSAGSADTALYLRSLGNLNCQTGRTLNYGDVYTYNTYDGNTGSPTTFTSVIGFGRGIAGTVEIAGGWDNTNLYWRSLRDCCEDWHSWRTVLDSSNYTEYINNYYWANVKISTSSSTTTSPTVSNLTATSSIRMGNIYLLNTNEINSASGIHLNYQNSGNISLCVGGGKVGIGTTLPTYKLDVNGDIHSSGTINCNSLNVDSTLNIKDSVISCSAGNISILSKESGSLLINSREVLRYDSDFIYMNNRIDLLHGLCFRTSTLDTTYNIYTTDDVTVLIGVLRDSASFKFRPAKDGLLLFLKIGKLYSDTYFWCTAENCVVVGAKNFGIYLDKNQNKDCFGDGLARIFIYIEASNRWYEFYCG